MLDLYNKSINMCIKFNMQFLLPFSQFAEFQLKLKLIKNGNKQIAVNSNA